MAQQKVFARQAVLIVEDEPLLRLMAIDVVEDAGFDAVEACDADEAIRILESRRDITIVFTDIDMPGSMDGLLLAAAVRDRWPPIQIIVTSGYARFRDPVLPPGAVFFRKPYDIDKVTEQLRAMASH
ncbi:MAG: response regulator [Rhizobiaceae bacterium]|nr:MAG: response regulator [Rhizobiaceae bacterium]